MLYTRLFLILHNVYMQDPHINSMVKTICIEYLKRLIIVNVLIVITCTLLFWYVVYLEIIHFGILQLFCKLSIS